MPAYLRNHRALLLLLLLSLLLHLSWRFHTSFIYDDAYITFRHAQNLANSQGFVYNPEERVQGTSTPLFALLLAAWLRIFPSSILPAAWLLGCVASLLSLVLVWNIFESLDISISRGGITKIV